MRATGFASALCLQPIRRSSPAQTSEQRGGRGAHGKAGVQNKGAQSQATAPPPCPAPITRGRWSRLPARVTVGDRGLTAGIDFCEPLTSRASAGGARKSCMSAGWHSLAAQRSRSGTGPDGVRHFCGPVVVPNASSIRTAQGTYSSLTISPCSLSIARQMCKGDQCTSIGHPTTLQAAVSLASYM